MTISIWRYSHLALAVSSFVFILLASITGIILAFQPISEQMQPYHVSDLGQVSLAETVAVFKKNYSEIIEINIDANGFVTASVFTEDGENLEGYFNPETAQYLGEKIKPSPFFQWVTNFHRSLFLKSTGRFLVGLFSSFLCLIALSGLVLVIKRQRGLKQFFSKVVNENFNQYWHVVLGRWSLIPIVIISLTGVYLSLEKFDVLPHEANGHHVNFETLKASPVKPISVFNFTQLSEVKSLEFPFSDDVEDYFILKLKNKELAINQFTGEILSEIPQSNFQLWSRLSLNLHTGKGSILWSLILAIAGVNIIYFVYSGFAMTLKRRKSRLKNKFKKNDCEYIISVGSENGSTFSYAQVLYEGLLKANKKVFISELNDFGDYPNAKHLIVMTATYGQGEAPTNANKFLDIVKEMKPSGVNYSVVGFGSLAYPDFCQFAFDADGVMNSRFSQFLKPFTINDKSIESFQKWVNKWSKKAEIPLSLALEELQTKPKQTKKATILSKTDVHNQPDDTFLLTLKSKRYQRFQSGDLLAVYPKNDYRERLYSIGKVKGHMQLSIKFYENGLGSNYLYNGEAGDILKGKIISNTHFHLPKKKSQVMMIANGTGVGPFLGMIDENKKHDIQLYLGLRTQDSYELYKSQVEGYLQDRKLRGFQLALSREHHKQYVQDLLLNDAEKVAKLLLSGGTIMVCGSLAMQNGVINALETICSDYAQKPLSYFQKEQQLKMDCY